MKKSKIISLLLSLVIISSLFAGCVADELTVFNAFTKSSSITSMESKTQITLNLSANGFAAKDKQSINQIVTMLNGSKLLLNQKTTSNDAKTITKSQTDVSMDAGGMALSASMWHDSDSSGTTSKFKEIFKLPSILTMAFPAKYQGKPYMVLDLNQLTKTSSSSGINTKELIAFSQNFTPKAMDFLKEYATQFDPGFTMLTRKEDKKVDGQTVSVYNLKLDDSSMKNLLSYTVTNFAKNEKSLTFVNDLLYSVNDLVSTSNTEKAKSKQEITKAFDDLKTDMPKFLENWNKAMAIIKDVKILGDKGININFEIDSNGYIVGESGTVDLLIDLKAYMDAGEKLSALENSSYKKQANTQTGIFKISIDFNSVISNINKDVVVDIPVLNSSNSFSYNDYLKSLTAPTPVVKKDTIAPKAPTVNKVLRTSKQVTGKAEIGSKIIVKKGKVVLGRAVTNSKGTFSVTIKPLKAKGTLLVTATDKSSNTSKATTVTVK